MKDDGRRVGIRFLLKYGHFMQFIVDRQDADDFFAKWSNGNWRAGGYVGNQTFPRYASGEVWVIPAEHIIGIHTFDASLLQQPQQGYQPPPGRGFGSSGNN